VPDPDALTRLAGHALELYARVFAESPVARLSRPRPVRRAGYELNLSVDRVRREADDVISIALADPDYRQLPAWNPGAHIDVFLPSGRLRQYSLCGDPRDRRRYRIAVRRLDDGHGGSREIHVEIGEGDTLRVRGPRNAFRLVDASGYVFVAGGIGITPIRPMVHAASRRGIPWELVYLGRSRATMPFLAELETCAGGRVLVHDDERDGFADVAAILARAAPGADLYICGPPALMDTTRQLIRAADARVPVFSEQFSAPPVLGGEPFTVTLARTGITLEVAENESALAAIRRHHPGVLYSCQQGFCRTCKCRVLDGEVDHRDSGTLLESERTDHMLICVSRAAGAHLTLDL
jgi:ferredoxin-NADP reductase